MCEKNLNVKKIRAISKIGEILNENFLTEFKIGKTNNCNERKRDYMNNGYTNFYEIVQCDCLEEVDKLERDLINYFKSNSKCTNKNDGGGGRTSESEEYHIYVVTK